MNYFIYKLLPGGIRPQAGYEQISMYKGTDTWILCRTANPVADIQALTGLEIMIIGVDADADIEAVYPDLRLQKRARIRSTGSSKLVAIAGEYTQEERETWEEQKAQAMAYLADNSASVPMLEAFAAGRGIPVAILAQGIMDNNALFQVASGQVMGQMYSLLDQVTGATDLNTALNIEWS